MSDLTPEEQVAKLQSELEQANARATDAEKRAKGREAWGRALQALRDEYPEHFSYVEARAFNRPDARKPSAPVTHAAVEEEPLDDLDKFKRDVLQVIEKQNELTNQRIETALRRLDGVQATQIDTTVRAKHPDLDQYQDQLNQVLERFPSLATSPEGMEIAATFVKKDKIANDAREAALTEITQREQAAAANWTPEPTAANAPDVDTLFTDGDTVHSALDKFFSGR